MLIETQQKGIMSLSHKRMAINQLLMVISIHIEMMEARIRFQVQLIEVNLFSEHCNGHANTVQNGIKS